MTGRPMGRAEGFAFIGAVVGVLCVIALVWDFADLSSKTFKESKLRQPAFEGNISEVVEMLGQFPATSLRVSMQRLFREFQSGIILWH
jgi:hypothetical protein